MGWMNFNFHCKTCDHSWDEIIEKEHGKDDFPMPGCPKQVDESIDKHVVERGVPSFSGVYDVGYYGKSRKMRK